MAQEKMFNYYNLQILCTQPSGQSYLINQNIQYYYLEECIYYIKTSNNKA